MEIDPWVIAVVVVGAFGAIVSGGTQIMTFIEKITNIKKPHDAHVEMVRRHDEKLLHDYEVIEEHGHRLAKVEDEIKEVNVQNRILIRSLKQLLQHVITGNHIDDLKVEYGILTRYLSGELKDIEKKTID